MMEKPQRNPSSEILKLAVNLRNVLSELLEQHENTPSISSRCQSLINSLTRCEGILGDTTYRFAFVGPVGSGKTTAICHLVDLLDQNGAPILPTGSGNSTLCDVELRQANRWRIVIEPCDDPETAALINDLVLFMLQMAGLREEQESQAELSTEFRRFFTNSIGLPRKNSDLIKEASRLWDENNHDHDSFHRALLDRLNLESRTCTAFDCPPGTDPRKWLQETFSAINLGKLPTTPIPRKVIIDGPIPFPCSDVFEILIVDTKGVEGQLISPSIDTYLNDPRTITLVTSNFKGAPHANCEKLFRHMTETGLSRTIASESSLLVIDQDEAKSVIGHDGVAGSTDEGRTFQEDQIEARLRQRLSMSDFPPIIFYDVHHDDRGHTLEVIGGLVDRLRGITEDLVGEISVATSELREEAAFLAAINEVAEPMIAWVEAARLSQVSFKKLPDDWLSKFPESDVNAQSLNAANQRRGDGDKVNYYFEISVCARKRVNTAFGGNTERLIAQLEGLQLLETLKPAHAFLGVVSKRLETRWRNLLGTVDKLTNEGTRRAMKYERTLWTRLVDQYGPKRKRPAMGTYKERVRDMLHEWFDNGGLTELENQLDEQVNEEWKRIVDEIETDLVSRLNPKE